MYIYPISAEFTVFYAMYICVDTRGKFTVVYYIFIAEREWKLKTLMLYFRFLRENFEADMPIWEARQAHGMGTSFPEYITGSQKAENFPQVTKILKNASFL